MKHKKKYDDIDVDMLSSLYDDSMDSDYSFDEEVDEVEDDYELSETDKVEVDLSVLSDLVESAVRKAYHGDTDDLDIKVKSKKK